MTSPNDAPMFNRGPALTDDHANALTWARAQTFGSVAARYAKLCAAAYDAEAFNHAGTREHLRLAREEIEKLEARIYQLNAASGKTGPV